MTASVSILNTQKLGSMVDPCGGMNRQMSLPEIKNEEIKNDKKKGCFAITKVAFKHDSEEESEFEDQTPCSSVDQTHTTIDSLEDSLIDANVVEISINKVFNENSFSHNFKDVLLEYDEDFGSKKIRKSIHTINENNVDFIVQKNIKISSEECELMNIHMKSGDVDVEKFSIEKSEELMVKIRSKRGIADKENEGNIENAINNKGNENSMGVEVNDELNENDGKSFERSESIDTLKGFGENIEAKSVDVDCEPKQKIISEAEKKKEVPNSRFKVFKLKSARGRWKCCDFFDDEKAAIVYENEDLRKNSKMAKGESHSDDTTIQNNHSEIVIIDQIDKTCEVTTSKAKSPTPLPHITIFNSQISGSSHCSKDEFFLNSLHIHSYNTPQYTPPTSHISTNIPPHIHSYHHSCFCHGNLQNLKTCFKNYSDPPRTTPSNFHAEFLPKKCLSNHQHNHTNNNVNRNHTTEINAQLHNGDLGIHAKPLNTNKRKGNYKGHKSALNEPSKHPTNEINLNGIHTYSNNYEQANKRTSNYEQVNKRTSNYEQANKHKHTNSLSKTLHTPTPSDSTFNACPKQKKSDDSIEISQKIAQAIDLAKHHLIMTTHSEMDILKLRIAYLQNAVTHLNEENRTLRMFHINNNNNNNLDNINDVDNNNILNNMNNNNMHNNMNNNNVDNNNMNNNMNNNNMNNNGVNNNNMHNNMNNNNMHNNNIINCKMDDNSSNGSRNNISEDKMSKCSARVSNGGGNGGYINGNNDNGGGDGGYINGNNDNGGGNGGYINGQNDYGENVEVNMCNKSRHKLKNDVKMRYDENHGGKSTNFQFVNGYKENDYVTENVIGMDYTDNNNVDERGVDVENNTKNECCNHCCNDTKHSCNINHNVNNNNHYYQNNNNHVYNNNNTNNNGNVAFDNINNDFINNNGIFNTNNLTSNIDNNDLNNNTIATVTKAPKNLIYSSES